LNKLDNHLPLQKNTSISPKQLTVTDIANMLTLYDLSEIELRGKIYFGPNAQIYYEQIGVETYTPYLLFLFDLLSDIADGYSIVMGVFKMG
jgi:hypothetical protein